MKKVLQVVEENQSLTLLNSHDIETQAGSKFRLRLGYMTAAYRGPCLPEAADGLLFLSAFDRVVIDGRSRNLLDAASFYATTSRFVLHPMELVKPISQSLFKFTPMLIPI